MKHLAAVIVSMFLVSASGLQAQTKPSDEMPLWPTGHVPGGLGTDVKDVPTLTIYRAATTRPGAAIVICPGGGYSHLAEHEGKGYAEWLQQQGITSFVLKYRLGSAGYRHPAMLEDAARVVRTVRANADAWQIDPHKVVIMGSSAGGHLAATLLTHFADGKTDAADPIERQSSRPDFGVLCYAVISMGDIAHAGSRQFLLGDHPNPDLVKSLSNELQVTEQTPPCFVWAGNDDTVVPVQNSIRFAAALAEHHVPYELHLYQHAPHGVGLGARQAPYEHLLPWTNDLLAWLRVNKLMP